MLMSFTFLLFFLLTIQVISNHFASLSFFSLEAKRDEIKGNQKAPNNIEVKSQDGQNIC